MQLPGYSLNHPNVIFVGTPPEWSFFVPPGQFLRELNEKREVNNH
jgi:hypothetical protein